MRIFAVTELVRSLRQSCRHTFMRRPGIVPKTGYAHHTVRQAVEDWLATGLDGRSPKTIKKNQNVLEPILKIAGACKLRELSAPDVRQALARTRAEHLSRRTSVSWSGVWPGRTRDGDTAAFRVSSSASDTASAQEPSGGRANNDLAT
jgi:hypothetical protein